MVQMPEPSRYAVVWLPSFHPETGREYQARRTDGNQCPNRQPTGRIWFLRSWIFIRFIGFCPRTGLSVPVSD